jgi:aminoglycoside phosphotransferase family enzyme
VSLDAKVAFLMRPDSYTSRPARVDAIETHMAWVFLTSNRAYKMKKPVRYSFLDFSTLDARRRDCELEVQLNRRLAPTTYLGTVSLTLNAAGALELNGAGQPVEWLVKMNRLPHDRMLDHAIKQRTWRREDITQVAELLVRFYQTAPTEAMTADTYAQRLRADLEESRSELVGTPALRTHRDRIEQVAAMLSHYLDNHRDHVDQRVAQGRIIGSHGDLRPEHVALGPPPQIIDCLEFNRSFRILDPADELSYLALECERLGAPEIGDIVLDHYSKKSGDHPPVELLRFYRAFRALLRAKIAVWHIADNNVRDPARWARRAIDYVQLGV